MNFYQNCYVKMFNIKLNDSWLINWNTTVIRQPRREPCSQTGHIQYLQMFLGSILSLGPGKSNGSIVDQYKARNMAKTDTTSGNKKLSWMVALLQPRVQFVGNMEENPTGHRCGCGHEVPLHQHRQQRAHMQQNDQSQSNPFGGGPNHSSILMHVHCKHVLGPSDKISVRDSYVYGARTPLSQHARRTNQCRQVTCPSGMFSGPNRAPTDLHHTIYDPQSPAGVCDPADIHGPLDTRNQVSPATLPCS